MPDTPPLIDHHPVRLRPCRHGPMLYLTTDVYIGRSLEFYGEFSHQETVLLQQLIDPGHTVLDIGANIGTLTVPLAQLVGPQGIVMAFEPQRFVFQILNANVAINALAQVHTRQVGVGQRAGTVSVPALDHRQELNFGGLSLLDQIELDQTELDQAEGEEVPIITIDDLSLDACHLMKIDVEGMEGDVIAGAIETINRFKPHLYVENDRKDRSAELLDRLFGLDYRLFWHLPPLYNPGNARGNTTNIFGNLVSVNMLAIHRSRPCSVMGLSEIERTNPRAPVF